MDLRPAKVILTHTHSHARALAGCNKLGTSLTSDSPSSEPSFCGLSPLLRVLYGLTPSLLKDSSTGSSTCADPGRDSGRHSPGSSSSSASSSLSVSPGSWLRAVRAPGSRVCARFVIGGARKHAQAQDRARVVTGHERERGCGAPWLPRDETHLMMAASGRSRRQCPACVPRAARAAPAGARQTRSAASRSRQRRLCLARLKPLSARRRPLGCRRQRCCGRPSRGPAHPRLQRSARASARASPSARRRPRARAPPFASRKAGPTPSPDCKPLLADVKSSCSRETRKTVSEVFS
jgi:hypothetical protein